MLVLVPLLTQQISKQFLISPIVNHVRGGNDTDIFLNSEMKELALRELQSFEEELKFESLIHNGLELPPEAMEEQVKQKASVIAQEFHKKSDSAISNVFCRHNSNCSLCFDNFYQPETNHYFEVIYG